MTKYYSFTDTVPEHFLNLTLAVGTYPKATYLSIHEPDYIESVLKNCTQCLTFYENHDIMAIVGTTLYDNNEMELFSYLSQNLMNMFTLSRAKLVKKTVEAICTGRRAYILVLELSGTAKSFASFLGFKETNKTQRSREQGRELLRRYEWPVN